MKTTRLPVTRSPNGVVRESPISVRLPPDLLEKIKTMAAGERRSVSSLIYILCEEALEARER